MQLITKDTIVVNTPPRINNIRFAEVLLSNVSPATGDAFAMFDAIVAEGVDPAFLLAVFKRESRYATDPASIVVHYQNFNMGNCRSSRIGVTDTITDPVKGVYVKYPDWATGAKDAAFRLVDKSYDYAKAGATTIGEIIKIWAPDGDGANDPTGYANTVVNQMNLWIGAGSNMTAAVPTQTDIGYPVRTNWAFDTGPGRTLNTVNTFVVHDTEGGMASDEQVLTANDSNIASAHALVAPDGTLVFMVPLETTAWTPGNDAVAEKSINIEISGFQSKGYTDAQYRSVAAFFNWCIAQGCPIPATYVGKSGTAGIIGHQDVPNPNQPGKFGGVSGHTDPGPLFDWGKLTNYIKQGSKINVNIDQGPVTQKPFNPNPLNKDVGPGVLETLTREGMTAITNEDYFVPDGNKPGLSKMSFTYADKGGVTYRVEAVQDLDANNQPLPTWKMQLWQFVKSE